MIVNLRENQVFLGEEEKIKAKIGDSRSSDPIPRSGNRRSKRFRAVSEQRTKEERESNRGTQREYSSKPLKHSIDKRILVFER